MITSRGIVERDRKTRDMLQFDPGERVRSVQLYGVDPVIMGRATEILINDFAVDHVDLNFGCPVPKVTRKGGGAALPYKRRWLELILTAVVGAATPYGVPVTMKTRIGIDHDHQTHLDAGRIAEQSGCAAIALHGRTAQQAYSGEADWDAIAALKQHVSIPVLGNGDIWEAGDALEWCGGPGGRRGHRSWVSRSAVAVPGPGGRVRRGVDPDPAHSRGGGEHGAPARGAAGGLQSTRCTGLAEMRKHMAWYFKGFPVGGDLRRSLGLISSSPISTRRWDNWTRTCRSRLPSWGPPRATGFAADEGGSAQHWLDDPLAVDLELAAPSSGSPVADPA